MLELGTEIKTMLHDRKVYNYRHTEDDEMISKEMVIAYRALAKTDDELLFILGVGVAALVRHAY